MSALIKKTREDIVGRHKNYHIHVYRVISVAEIDIKAISDEKALNAALDTVKNQKFKTSDCNYIAIIPEEDKE